MIQPSAPPASGLPGDGDSECGNGGGVSPTLPVAAARTATPKRPQSQPEENSRFEQSDVIDTTLIEYKI